MIFNFVHFFEKPYTLLTDYSKIYKSTLLYNYTLYIAFALQNNLLIFCENLEIILIRIDAEFLIRFLIRELQ